MIEKKLGYRFKDRGLLKTALTHSSYANENLLPSNERLEFLGDAVLTCVAARFLYEHYKEAPEGELSKLRGALVSTKSFAELAKRLRIDREILLGKGERMTGGVERESNLAGAFEAVVGALFLDGGYKVTYRIASRLYRECLKRGEIAVDYKSELQEIAQKEYGKVPQYKVVLEEGKAHDRRFHVEVKIGRRVLGKGEGKSKKEAERDAARAGLERLKDNMSI